MTLFRRQRRITFRCTPRRLALFRSFFVLLFGCRYFAKSVKSGPNFSEILHYTKCFGKYGKYEVWLSNNETAYEKWFYLKNYSTIERSPSLYLPTLTTHQSIHFFHWSKQCWKSSFVSAFRNSADFRFTSSIDSTRIPFKIDLIFGKRKKSQGAKSGKWDVCSSTGVLLTAK